MPTFSQVVYAEWAMPAAPAQQVIYAEWTMPPAPAQQVIYAEWTMPPDPADPTALSVFSLSVDRVTGIATLELDTSVIEGTMYLQTFDTDPGVVTAPSVVENATDSQAVVASRVTFTIPNGGFGDTDYYAVVQDTQASPGFSDVFFTEVDGWTFDRTSEATVVDFEGLVKELPPGIEAHPGARVVVNLATDVTTETITVVSGNEYVVTIKGDNGATAVLGNAATDTLTADGTNRITHDNGTPVTASSTSLVVTVTGTLTELLVEDATGQSNQNPSEFVVDAQSFDYENGNTVDGNGVVTGAQGAAITGIEGVLLERSRTNLLLNSDAPATQSVTVAAVEYTLSMTGTGSIDISGVATGTATEAAPLTFTPTAGSLTCTVVGTVDTFQLEAGAFPTSYIPTAGAPVTRSATSMDQTLASMGLPDLTNNFKITAVLSPAYGSDNCGNEFRYLVCLTGDGSNSFRIYTYFNGYIYARGFLDGVFETVGVPTTWAAGDKLTIVVERSAAGCSITVNSDTATDITLNTDYPVALTTCEAGSCYTFENSFFVMESLAIEELPQ